MMITEKRLKQKAEAQKRYKLSKKGQITQKKYYTSQAKRDSCKKWREKNTIKILAHKIVDRAKKDRMIASKPCEVCKKPNAFAHHDDYSKPLEIRWLCNLHHSEYHRNIKGKRKSHLGKVAFSDNNGLLTVRYF